MTRTPVDVWPPTPPEFPPFPGRPTPPAEPAPRPGRGPALPSWVEPDPGMARELADRLLKHRVLLASGYLDATMADSLAAQLLLVGRAGEEPVELHLACPGSDLAAALALADAVDLAPVPVRAVVRGTLRGPVVAVLTAATERLAHRHALVILSVPPLREDAREPRRAEERERQVGVLRDRLAEVTGRSADEVAADLVAGRVLRAKEAVAYGLLDRLL